MKCHSFFSIALVLSAPIAVFADYDQSEEGHDGKVTEYVTRYVTICPVPTTCVNVAPTGHPYSSGPAPSESEEPAAPEEQPEPEEPIEHEEPTETLPQGSPTDYEMPAETHPTIPPPGEPSEPIKSGTPSEPHPTDTQPPYPTGSGDSSYYGPTDAGYTSSSISSDSTYSHYPTGTGYGLSASPINSADSTMSETYPTSSAVDSTASSEVHPTTLETSLHSPSSSETTYYSDSITSSTIGSETASYTSSATASATSSESDSYTSSATSSATASETSSYTSSATTSETSSITSSTTTSSSIATTTDCVPKMVPAPSPPSGSTCEKTGGTSAVSMGEHYTGDAASCALICRNTSGCGSTSYDVSNPDTHLCRLYGSSAAGGINEYGGYTFYDQGCWRISEDCASPTKR